MVSVHAINYMVEDVCYCKTALHEKDANFKKENYRFSEPKMPMREQNDLADVSVGGGLC